MHRPRRDSIGNDILTFGEFRGWTLLIAGAAYWGNVIRTSQSEDMIGLSSIARSIVNHGAFNIAAWAMIAAWVSQAGPRGFASRGQIAAGLAIGLLLVVPTRQTTIVGLIALGWTFAIPTGTGRDRQIATLLIALAVEMVWTSTYLLPLHSAVAMLDVRVCEAILGLLGDGIQAHGNLLENARAGIDLEVLSSCASSFPLAGVVMAFLVTMIYWGRLPRLADMPWLAAALLASIALTELRLSLMAQGPIDYTWIHNGEGVPLYTLSATALAVLFPSLAMLRRDRLPAYIS